jgi:hypothetical protein
MIGRCKKYFFLKSLDLGGLFLKPNHFVKYDDSQTFFDSVNL